MVGHPDNFYFCKLDTSKRVAAATLSFFRREKCASFSQKKLDTSAHPPVARLGRLALPHLTI